MPCFLSSTRRDVSCSTIEELACRPWRQHADGEMAGDKTLVLSRHRTKSVRPAMRRFPHSPPRPLLRRPPSAKISDMKKPSRLNTNPFKRTADLPGSTNTCQKQHLPCVNPSSSCAAVGLPASGADRVGTAHWAVVGLGLAPSVES